MKSWAAVSAAAGDARCVEAIINYLREREPCRRNRDIADLAASV